MDRAKLINSFPNEKIAQARDGLSRLIQLGFVTLSYIRGKCIVVIPKVAEAEALRIVDPDFVFHKSNTPKQELIPKDYIPEPFHVFYGEKEIHKAVSEYWLCRKKKDKEFVGCFIFNSDSSKSSISIGRISDRNSLASKYLFEMNRLFNGRAFFKYEIKKKFPKSLTRNRQPIKAVTEYLCLEGYLERIGSTSKFKRTDKAHIVNTLDTGEKVKRREQRPISMWPKNGQPLYYYSDEDGLYPNLS